MMEPPVPAQMNQSQDRFWVTIIYILSVVISGAVMFLILGPRPEGVSGGLDVAMLPTVNASLNACTCLLLLIGYGLIRRHHVRAHRNVMLAAFGLSCLFLVTYVIYHWFKSGPKLYEGEFTVFYYSVLISHILLAALIVPLALFTLYRGWTDDIAKHRRVARITLPIWLYVSVTGVLIYAMLYL